MLKLKYARVALLAIAFTALTLSNGTRSQRPRAATDHQSLDQSSFSVIEPDLGNWAELSPESPEPPSSNSTFYTVRPDLRRCVSPLCGGYFVKRVNVALTRCPNGRLMAECYVAVIDWNGQSQIDPGKALLRGDVVARRFGHFGNLGALRVHESWQAAGDDQPTGVFYRVRDRGVRCITFPCPSHSETKLNSTFTQSIAGVDLTGARAKEDLVSQALAALTGSEGVLVSGNHTTVSGPGGKMPELKAIQFYLRAGKLQAMKPCRKTGCSSQICADKEVITTCEWRPEYACYQKATCERQKDGNCGFTRTPELTACLSGK